MNTQVIPVSHVYFDSYRRALSRPAVKELAQSMTEVGLLNPITVVQVGEAFNLVAGLHRLKAAQQLGWAEIEATIIDPEKIDRQLAEIDENLIRHHLTAAQRARLTGDRERIYVQKHPETKRGGDRGNQHTGGKPRLSANPAFSQDTAGKTGRSRRSVAVDTHIAKAIPADVFEQIEASAIADSQTDLLALGRLPEDAQREVVASVDLTDKAAMRTAIDERQPAPKPKPVSKITAETTEVVTTVDGFVRAIWTLFDDDERRQIADLISDHEGAQTGG